MRSLWESERYKGQARGVSHSFKTSRGGKVRGKTHKEQAGRQEDGLISVVQMETHVSSCVKSTCRAC